MTSEAILQETPASSRRTTCCVVGGGPAGTLLALLLARRGVAVTLLEAHHDLDRDFRGDTVHPSTLEVLDQIGLADRLLALPHGRMHALVINTPDGPVQVADLSSVRTRFPYVMILPQVQLLDCLVAEARRFTGFALVFGAKVEALVEEGGAIRGVRYRGPDDAWHEVRADLVVGADGRFSKIRALLGFEPVRSAPPMDVIWFRLPRLPEDAEREGGIYAQGGSFTVVLGRPEDWQIGYVILKGSYAELRAAGIQTLRERLSHSVPWLASRTASLTDWKQTSMLSVESSRLTLWHKPGVLLIGDAAHTMSPVGGVGINYAIQDAVEAANVLVPALRAGTPSDAVLAEVQRRRERAVRVIQSVQGVLQSRIAAPALKGQRFALPWPARVLSHLPLLRSLPGRMIGFGLKRVRVEND
jgi:2-polyprenyl-6-methoxyphenol hydroxylase-like FAD-dependent oxidoreductase